MESTYVNLGPLESDEIIHPGVTGGEMSRWLSVFRTRKGTRQCWHDVGTPGPRLSVCFCFWDALIGQTRPVRCTFWEVMQAAQEIDGVHVVNPFR